MDGNDAELQVYHLLDRSFDIQNWKENVYLCDEFWILEVLLH